MAVLHELKPKPNADLLEMVDNLRRDIETGEVSGFAFAVVNRGGGGATGWNAGCRRLTATNPCALAPHPTARVAGLT